MRRKKSRTIIKETPDKGKEDQEDLPIKSKKFLSESKPSRTNNVTAHGQDDSLQDLIHDTTFGRDSNVQEYQTQTNVTRVLKME